MNKTFCILPFIHLSTRTNGDMQLCCTANSGSDSEYPMIGCNRKNDGTIVNLKNDNFVDYWNSDWYKNIRKDLIEGKEPKSCRKCYREEKIGNHSKRMWENKKWDSIDIDINEHMPVNIKYIDIKLGNKCNLACAMCNPNDSTGWIPDAKKLNMPELNWSSNTFNWYKNNDQFWDNLKIQMPNVESIYIIGGEPTIISEFKMFLQDCIENGYSKNISLRFNTNGHGYDDELKELYKRFKHVLVNLSIDAFGARHTYIRYPSTLEDLDKVLNYYNNMPKNVTVNIDTTASIYNIYHIPDLIKWKVEQGYSNINPRPDFSGLIGIHLLWKPEFLSPRILPKEMKEDVTNKYEDFNNWLIENNYSGYTKTKMVINYMNGEDWSNKLPSFKRYVTQLDKIRGLNFADTFSELKILI